MAGQLSRRGDRTFVVRIFTGRDSTGTRRYVNKTVHGTKKEADAVMRDMLAKRDGGQLVARSRTTLNDYLDAWLTNIGVRTRTREEYRSTLKSYVRPYLGESYLSDITLSDGLTMLAKLRERGLASRTVRKAHETLRNALEQAHAEGIIPANPARNKAISKALPATEHVERETVPMAKVKTFLMEADKGRYAAYWRVLLFCGLRPSEALGLKWADIEGDTLHIRRTLSDRNQGPLEFVPTKTKRSKRTIILPKVVKDALAAHRARQAAERLKAGASWTDNDLIFCNVAGGPLRQAQTRASFSALLKAAELPAMRIYDLRHSAATLALEMGIPLKVVSEMLGHSTIALTANTYSHVTPTMQAHVAETFDRLAG